MVKNFSMLFLLCLSILSASTAHGMRRSLQAVKPGLRGFMPNVASRVAQKNSLFGSSSNTYLASSKSMSKTVAQTVRASRRLHTVTMPTISRTLLFTGAGLGTGAVVVYGTTKYAPSLPSFAQKDFFTHPAKAFTDKEIVEYLTQKKIEFNERIVQCFGAETLETFKDSLNDLAAALESDTQLNNFAQSHIKEFNAILTNNPDGKFAAQPYELTMIIAALKKAAEQIDPSEMFVHLKDILSILPGDLQNSQYVSTQLEKLEQATRTQEKQISLSYTSTLDEWNQVIEKWESSLEQKTPQLAQIIKEARSAQTPLLKAFVLQDYLPQLAPSYMSDQQAQTDLDCLKKLKVEKEYFNEAIYTCLGITEVFNEATLNSDEFKQKDALTWEEYFDIMLTKLKEPQVKAMFEKYPVEAQEIFAPHIPEQYVAKYRLNYTDMIATLERVRNIKQTWKYKTTGVVAVGLELLYFFYYLPADLQTIVMDKSSKRITNGASRRLGMVKKTQTADTRDTLKEAAEIK